MNLLCTNATLFPMIPSPVTFSCAYAYAYACAYAHESIYKRGMESWSLLPKVELR